MPRASLPLDDAFLTAEECAERVRVNAADWWGLAKSHPWLERYCYRTGRNTYWLKSAVVRLLHLMAGGGRKANPRVEAMRRARAALALRNEAAHDAQLQREQA